MSPLAAVLTCLPTLLGALQGCTAPAGVAPGEGVPADTAPADTSPRDSAATDPAADDTSAPPDDSANDTADEPSDDGLVGVRLDPPLEPPPFEVLNQLRETRTPDWLVGDPSVLWFFRDAGST